MVDSISTTMSGGSTSTAADANDDVLTASVAASTGGDDADETPRPEQQQQERTHQPLTQFVVSYTFLEEIPPQISLVSLRKRCEFGTHTYHFGDLRERKDSLEACAAAGGRSSARVRVRLLLFRPSGGQIRSGGLCALRSADRLVQLRGAVLALLCAHQTTLG